MDGDRVPFSVRLRSQTTTASYRRSGTEARGRGERAIPRDHDDGAVVDDHRRRQVHRVIGTQVEAPGDIAGRVGQERMKLHDRESSEGSPSSRLERACSRASSRPGGPIVRSTRRDARVGTDGLGSEHNQRAGLSESPGLLPCRGCERRFGRLHGSASDVASMLAATRCSWGGSATSAS